MPRSSAPHEPAHARRSLRALPRAELQAPARNVPVLHPSHRLAKPQHRTHWQGHEAMGARRLEGAAPTKVLSPASLTRRRVPLRRSKCPRS